MAIQAYTYLDGFFTDSDALELDDSDYSDYPDIPEFFRPDMVREFSDIDPAIFVAVEE